MSFSIESCGFAIYTPVSGDMNEQGMGQIQTDITFRRRLTGSERVGKSERSRMVSDLKARSLR